MPARRAPSPVRIVSLAPGATATLSALGAAEAVVGVTNHCPLDRERLGGWLDPDRDRVVALDPDLVVTGDALQAEVRDGLRDRGCEVHHRNPTTLRGVVESMETLGAAVGRADAGRELRRDCERRLARVRERVPDGDRPTVYCEEWPDPPMVAGNWVPAAVEAAGADYPFRDPGERSGEADPAAVAAADPDHVVLHYCGYGERADPEAVRDRDGWDLGDATVHVLHDDLLNQPSPELVAGVERLAALVHGVDVG
ncbi:MAG: helical backbone metal receptor [Halolamina sp.]